MTSVPFGPNPALSNILGFIDISHAHHFVKLRQNFKLSKQLRLELGVDWNVKINDAKPYTGLKLLFDENKPLGWAVECNTDWALIQSPRVDLFSFTDKFSLPLSLRIGTDFYNNDAAHVEVGMHNNTVALGLVAAMLYLKKPFKITRKEAGLFSVAVPMTLMNGKVVDQTLNQKVEIDATVARTDNSFKVQFNQLNGVLRIRQDD